MQRVVIDTNVLLSSMFSSKGNPAEIMDLITNGEVELCYSREILEEYERKLAEPKFKFTVDMQKAIINDVIKEIGVLVDDPVPSHVKIRDLDDGVFYDVAKENDAILITGDNDLLVLNENFIVKPAEYLKMRKEYFNTSEPLND